MSFFLFQNEGQGAAHRGGHPSPFFGVWEGRGAGARWAPSSADRAGRRDLRPLQPRDLGALPQTPQLLKKLAKLLRFSPKPKRGAATSRWDVAQRPTEPAGETKASVSQKTPPPQSGVRVLRAQALRRELRAQALGADVR